MDIPVVRAMVLNVALVVGLGLTGAASAAEEETAVVYGNGDAAVSIIELTDYQCPFCKILHPKLLKWVKGNDQVRLAVREVALINSMSIFAAKAALAAGNQNKRHELHERLMVYRGALSEKVVLNMAKQQGIDVDRLQQDMRTESERYDAILASNLLIGLKRRMRGTPSFLINGHFIETSDLDEIKDTVAKALAEK